MHEATRRKPPSKTFRNYTDKKEMLALAHQLGAKQAPQVLGISPAELSHLRSDVKIDDLFDDQDRAQALLQQYKETKPHTFWKRLSDGDRRCLFEHIKDMSPGEVQKRYNFGIGTTLKLRKQFDPQGLLSPSRRRRTRPQSAAPEPRQEPAPAEPTGKLDFHIELTRDEEIVLRGIAERVIGQLIRKALR